MLSIRNFSSACSPLLSSTSLRALNKNLEVSRFSFRSMLRESIQEYSSASGPNNIQRRWMTRVSFSNSESPSWLKPSLYAAALLILFGVNSFEMIEPGNVGIVVNLFGEGKGIQEKERTVGIQFVPLWKKMYKFPIFEQNHIWDKDKKFTFQTSDGLVVDAEIGITYHLQSDKIHILFAKYRRGMEEITHVFLRNYIRDSINTCASKLKIEDLYGVAKEKFMEDVQKSVHDALVDEGIVIGRIYLIGNLNFPPNVVQALNAKIEAIQRAQQRENELREAKAEAEKKYAHAEGEAKSALIAAEAQAKANKIISNSLTSELLRWKELEKWDGKLPVAVGNNGLVLPVLKEG